MTDSQSTLDPLAEEPTGADLARRERRASLLAAARRLFLARGFANTPVSAIVREAGVAQGTFYLYFRSKEGVLAHLRVEILDDYLRSFVGAESDASAPADARLVGAMLRVREAVARQRTLTRVLRCASTSEEIDAIWIRGRESLSIPLAELLAAGESDGSWRLDDRTMTARLILTLLDDLLYEAIEYEYPAPIDETFAAALRFVLRALGVGEARLRELVSPAKPTRAAGGRRR